VVHYVQVDYLEQYWERVFIHDSYACRRGKGVHKAVDRPQQFLRQATVNRKRPPCSRSAPNTNSTTGTMHPLWRGLA